MSKESANVEPTSDTEAWGNEHWLLFLVSTLLMLAYEYVWSRLALHNRATITFGGWLWPTLAIAAPWNFCIYCLSWLKNAAKHGKMGREDCSDISVWVGMVMLATYMFFVPAIHRLPSLGALN